MKIPKAPFILAFFLIGLYFAFPLLIKAILSIAGFTNANRDALMIGTALQKGLAAPLSGFIALKAWKVLFIVPWFLAISFLLWRIHRWFKGRYRYVTLSIIALFLILRVFPNLLLIGENDQPSKSFGTPGNGRLENGKRVPFSGDNFTTYSFFGFIGGRTFVHGKVKKIVLDTYKKCAASMPDQHFVLMETGHRKGGRFSPHRTHQSGMSVDFMTPLKKQGNPYDGHSIFSGWGYGRKFDNKGKTGKLEIDYETMAHHLLLLYETARENGLTIKKVIFDPVLQPYLFKTKSGKKLKGKFYFTRGRVTFRHDDHYHVDFGK